MKNKVFVGDIINELGLGHFAHFIGTWTPPLHKYFADVFRGNQVKIWVFWAFGFLGFRAQNNK